METNAFVETLQRKGVFWGRESSALLFWSYWPSRTSKELTPSHHRNKVLANNSSPVSDAVLGTSASQLRTAYMKLAKALSIPPVFSVTIFQFKPAYVS